ncbi:MAG: beta-galactosidase [Opitutaceae bacterium]|nr:beta-galactosidase [Opitutaceae bacterium]
MISPRTTCLVLLLSVLLQMVRAEPPERFEIGKESFLLDGRPFVIRCGEVHYTRVPREYWRHRLQAVKAMGLNTVCVYLFWNYHEWKPGTFDWSGERDAAEFCRIAQEEGLWVMLRPGPYSCAEWEMGGLPWWLLKEDVSIRSTDPRFLEPAKRYLREVGRVFAPLQVTRGGPILMVQVENEYGSFGNDGAYLDELRAALKAAGFDVPLFQCNPPYDLTKAFLPDLFTAVNFGRGPQAAFAELRKLQPSGPLMNAEYYPGWFDGWGRPHKTAPIEGSLADLSWMLENRASFSIYMAHGGTTFGLWSGTDRPFRPDTSSYDYDAPISESGSLTPKFFAIRDLMSRHLGPGETLPPPPAELPVAEIAPFAFTERIALASVPGIPMQAQEPVSFEKLNHGRGAVAYEVTLPAGAAASLVAARVADFGFVYLGDDYIGAMDRRAASYRVALPARATETTLRILVYAMGRVNFGPETFDPKGLFGPVALEDETGRSSHLHGWTMRPMDIDALGTAELAWTQAGPVIPNSPTLWRGTFHATAPADTFLDLRSWGKGVVWVNGHCLGRFWNIGPTQTMYCPGVWLRAGANEVRVLDLLGPAATSMQGLAKPILDELRPELDFGPVRRVAGPPVLAGLQPVAAGELEASGGWKTLTLNPGVSGRFLCLQFGSSSSGGARVSMAELEVIDETGQPLSRSGWRVLWVSSEGMSAGEGVAENLLDGQSASYWINDWGQKYPQRIILDLASSSKVSAIRLLPRQDGAADWAKAYEIYLSHTPFNLRLP